MTLEEYKKQMEQKEDWAPGWDAIDSCFAKLYPGQEPRHYATDLVHRAIFGGEEFLDGVSIYQSENGYKHIVTYGMSALYADEKDFGNDYSRWGYEMTIKLPVETDEECIWAISLLSNMARYTYTQQRFFEPYQGVPGSGVSIKQGVDSKLTGLLVVEDTEIQGIDTVHGRLEFMQFIGITNEEVEEMKKGYESIVKLLDKMKEDNPMLITDINRNKSCV